MTSSLNKQGSEVSGDAEPGQIRNVVLVGPASGGKTTLVESVLYHAGVTGRAGRVEDGNTVGDHDPIEKELGRSISLSVVSFCHEGVTINLVDTPGHADFVGEVRAGLRAADAALFVVSAVDGVDGATRLLWQECAQVRMPRAIVVTHVDQQRGDFTETLEHCRATFGEGVQPLYLPVPADGEPESVLGLLSQQVIDASDPSGQGRPADEELREQTADRRDGLIEQIIQESEDDALLDRWLSGDAVDQDTLIADLEKAVSRGSFHPVLPAVGTSGLGAAQVLEAIVRGFPSPLEHPLPAVTSPDGKARVQVSCNVDGPLVAEVVRSTTDPYVGRVCLVRVFSGRLLPDTAVHVSGHMDRFTKTESGHPDHDVDERVGALSRVSGATLTPVPEGIAGDIIAVARLGRAETGDTVSDTSAPALMEPWAIPEPLLPVAVSAHTSADEDKLSQGLSRLAAEDPTVRVEQNAATNQLVLWTMGESHLDVLRERLRTRHGVTVDTGPVKVALRETLRGPGAGHGRHVKQSGGHGQFAVCDIEVEPLPEGSGFEFVDKVVGGAVPRQFIPSVEKGVRAQMDKGVAAGYPMVDLRISLVGGKAHSVDSSDAAFQMAGALALKEAAAKAGVSLLEPIDEVRVIVDDEDVGTVLGDLSSRRGRVTGTTSANAGRTEVTAEVPAIELTRYATDLRSMAHGSGEFHRLYLHHAPMPHARTEEVVAQARG